MNLFRRGLYFPLCGGIIVLPQSPGNGSRGYFFYPLCLCNDVTPKRDEMHSTMSIEMSPEWWHEERQMQTLDRPQQSITETQELNTIDPIHHAFPLLTHPYTNSENYMAS